MRFPHPFPRRAAGTPQGGSSHSSGAPNPRGGRGRWQIGGRKSDERVSIEERVLRRERRKRRLRHAGEAAVAGATFMSMAGPRRFRPYFQQIVALIGVLGSTVALFTGRDK
ncbi:hypothetical protein [Oecophyllibacter saccharovorans]|uniref:Uncharacterized protein n=1 Tax=Oecophyllibacter saccharovorans TaxID=2558360 RepID=A0A506UKJ1_9PROT|nr:hypothetical protein [Oecophyllibacter saccharovorans]TPW33838.1 hypothetical protein E3202_04370 [Oecophyllibacter saccharovorans]